MKSVLTIGHLKRIELLDPQSGRTAFKSMKGKWLAWDTAKNNYLICTVKGKIPGRLPSSIAAKHRKFHCADPNPVSMRGECPSPSGALRPIGLLKSLVYKVPSSIHSPGKNGSLWNHELGDTGHRGGSYSPKVMPLVLQDSRGNIFFRRRKGNIYKVDTWLRG